LTSAISISVSASKVPVAKRLRARVARHLLRVRACRAVRFVEHTQLPASKNLLAVLRSVGRPRGAAAIVSPRGLAEEGRQRAIKELQLPAPPAKVQADGRSQIVAPGHYR